MFTMLIGYIFFDIIISDKITNFSICVIILGVLQLFYNEEDLIYFLGDKKQKFFDYVKQNDTSYDEVEMDFAFDYDR